MDLNNKWGLGFTVWNSNGINYVGHGGICAGYRSQLTLQPKEKIAGHFLDQLFGCQLLGLRAAGLRNCRSRRRRSAGIAGGGGTDGSRFEKI